MRLHLHVYTQWSPPHVWVSVFLCVIRSFHGSWTGPTCSPLPNGLFCSLVHHPWASMCQPHTSFILHGNLTPHCCLAPLAIILLCWAFSKIICVGFKQGSQYCTGGCTGLASGTIYFRYRSIPVYRFGFTAIFYIYKYIYIYVCMYVCMYVCVCIYIIINIKVYHKTFPQFRINYSWF